MNAVKFIRERERMCNENSSCNQCAFYKSEVEPDGMSCKKWVAEYPEKTVAFVERWSKEHPIKTRQSKFLEMFPDALIASDGVLDICPLECCGKYRNERGECLNPQIPCRECARKFWLEES